MTQPDEPQGLTDAECDAIIAKVRSEYLVKWGLDASEYHRMIVRAGAAAARDAVPRSLNLNDTVRVKIKPEGVELLRREYEARFADYPKVGPYTPPKVDNDGYSRWQLWSFMQDFGPHIHLGMLPPFETEILLDAYTQAEPARRAAAVPLGVAGCTCAIDGMNFNTAGCPLHGMQVEGVPRAAPTPPEPHDAATKEPK